ncbi:hypothetical protein CR973_00855 [Candidatus Saccharibacteria bacterium]|nr:MAG: hypothetical protein CR973_00855 [Candidatus Saccharibacteria bacterium]
MHNIRKIYLSNFLTGLVFWYAIKQLFMIDIGLGATGIGIEIAFLAVFALLFDIPSGMLADRWGRKNLLITAAIALGIASGIYGMSGSLAIFLLGTVFYGIYFVSASGTYQALTYDTLYDLGKTELYSKIAGRSHGLFLIGVSVGNIVSGVIASSFSYRAAFFVTIVSCILNVIVIATIREPKHHRNEISEKFLSHVRTVLKAITRQTALAGMLVIVAMIAALDVYFIDFGQLYMEHYGAGVAVIGVLWAVYALALAFGSFVAHYFAGRLWLAVALTSVPVFVIYLVDHPATIAVIFVQAVGMKALFNRIETRIQNATPSRVRATVLSVISALGRMVAIPVGIWLGMMISDGGIRAGLVVPTAAAFIILAAAAFVWRYNTSISRRHSLSARG